jgi:hypothetical protein
MIQPRPPPRAKNQSRPLPFSKPATRGRNRPVPNFRLAVSGPIGVKEIERLIQKLELDKEILADPDAEKDEAAN